MILFDFTKFLNIDLSPPMKQFLKIEIKILLTIMIIIFSAREAYSEKYHNPNWKHGIIYDVADENKALYPYLIIDLSFPIDYMEAIYMGIFYQSSVEARFSRFINFDLGIKLGENIPGLDTITTSWLIYPIPFINVSLNYRYRNFSEYLIGEHDISLFMNNYFDFKKMPYWLEIHFLLGMCFRFIDIDITDNNSKYMRDWFFETFFIWQIKTLFSPLFWYSTGLSMGNYDRYAVYTGNYLQFEFLNYFHFPNKITLFVNLLFSYVGTLPLAGKINRFSFEVGGRFEIQTK